MVSGLIDISNDEFESISRLVYEKFGINLTEKKRVLVRGRLNKILRTMGYDSFQSYYDWIINDTTGMGLLELVDKISTNHTMFFRESDHFLFLEQVVIPDVTEKLSGTGKRDLRVWCAGCATGEEAYSLAMILAEEFGLDYFTDGPPVLATDISLSALETAKSGIYSSERIKLVPRTLLHKYFRITGKGEYSVKDELKKLIVFKRLNLMREHFPFKGRFHFIFCRNVMIYFDQRTKEKLVYKFADVLNESGFLFIGHSETLGRNNPFFRYVKPALYIKKSPLEGPLES